MENPLDDRDLLCIITHGLFSYNARLFIEVTANGVSYCRKREFPIYPRFHRGRMLYHFFGFRLMDIESLMIVTPIKLALKTYMIIYKQPKKSFLCVKCYKYFGISVYGTRIFISLYLYFVPETLSLHLYVYWTQMYVSVRLFFFAIYD